MQRLAIAPHQRTGDIIHFTSDQIHYLSRVLRLKERDRVMVFDGSGALWVVELQGNQGHILQTETNHNELPAHVMLMVGLTKGDGFEEVVRCCTELGVREIMPIISDRCVVKPNPKRLDRWQRIATEAAEQSERVIIPTIHPPRSWGEGLTHTQDYDLKWIAAARYRQRSLMARLHQSSSLITSLSHHPTMAIATGPEGGWTPAELDQAQGQGFAEIALGKRILRAVTAPIAIMAVVSNFLEA